MFVRNEMKCLSNAVLQSCINQDLEMVLAVPGLIRKMVLDRQVPVKDIVKVWLWQYPEGQGIVKFRVEMIYDEGEQRRSYHEEFRASSLKFESKDYVLYDRSREGVLEYLHLVH